MCAIKCKLRAVRGVGGKRGEVVGVSLLIVRDVTGHFNRIRFGYLKQFDALSIRRKKVAAVYGQQRGKEGGMDRRRDRERRLGEGVERQSKRETEREAQVERRTV